MSGVRGVANLVCVVHDSRLEVYNSAFRGNQARPFLIGDQTNVVVHGSIVSNNVVSGAGGGGMWVEGNADVTITGSSVDGNSATRGGGGLSVDGNARVSIAGGSSISKNTAEWGAGLVASRNASVTLTGGSSVNWNKAGGNGRVCFFVTLPTSWS